VARLPVEPSWLRYIDMQPADHRPCYRSYLDRLQAGNGLPRAEQDEPSSRKCLNHRAGDTDPLRHRQPWQTFGTERYCAVLIHSWCIKYDDGPASIRPSRQEVRVRL